jgi:hypothetical protein
MTVPAVAAAHREVSGRLSVNDWLVTYRKPAPVAVAAIVVFVMPAFDVSWAALFIVLAVAAVLELVLTGIRPVSARGEAG